MSKLGLAFKAFFRILGNAEFADRVRALFDAPSAVADEGGKIDKPTVERSDALTLLANGAVADRLDAAARTPPRTAVRVRTGCGFAGGSNRPVIPGRG